MRAAQHPLSRAQWRTAAGDHWAVSAAFIGKLRRPVFGALVAMLASPAAASSAAPATPEQLDAAGVHEIVVKRAPSLEPSDRAQVRAAADVTLEAPLRLPDTEVVRAAPGHLAEALAALRADPGVVSAAPNVRVHAFTADAYWAQQWALHNVGQTPPLHGAASGVVGADISAPAAWAIGATGAGQVVAIVDSGVNAAHPDLAGQIATTPVGYDWVDGDANPDDANGHGSHVAAIVAARQGRRGISGVAPDARILALRVLDENGGGWSDDIADAYDYAGDKHVGIVNASLGGPDLAPVESEALDLHPETLYVVAAGNDGVDNDVTPTYPCAAPQDNVICVGATDNRDRPAVFSNYGHTSVDLFAPGVQIVSAWKAPEFGWWFDDGTSMAAPHVAGALALMRAAAPALDAAELKQALLSSVDKLLPQLHDRAVTEGRLDAEAAVRAARDLSTADHPGADTDHDTFPDVVDDCPSAPDALQSDGDGDGIGDACDPAPNGPDEDADGVPDTRDDCLYLPNAGQLDTDGDGAGDPCDPTPGTTTPPPAVTPPPAAAPAPPPPPSGSAAPAAPVLGALKAPSSTPTVRLCRAGAHGCRPAPLRVTYRLDRATAVTAQVQRRECRAGRCRYVTAATVHANARPGANTLTIGARGATARLRAGRYRLRVIAGGAGAASRPRLLAFRVR
jgi:thermitase